ncbi:hypothetical protein D6774_03605, partial [Candidatus Woesearchaeota archaeon]
MIRFGGGPRSITACNVRIFVSDKVGMNAFGAVSKKHIIKTYHFLNPFTYDYLMRTSNPALNEKAFAVPLS